MGMYRAQVVRMARFTRPLSHSAAQVFDGRRWQALPNPLYHCVRSQLSACILKMGLHGHASRVRGGPGYLFMILSKGDLSDFVLVLPSL